MLLNNSTHELLCGPSLHSTDCHRVAHDCRILRACYEHYRPEFRKLEDSNFDCNDEYYRKPEFKPAQVIPQFKIFDSNLTKIYAADLSSLSDPICTEMFPNIMIAFKEGLLNCQDLSITPKSNCRDFLRQCDGKLTCSIEHRSQCKPQTFTGPLVFARECDHWRDQVERIEIKDTGEAVFRCITKVVPYNLKNPCDYQRKICRAEDACINHWTCNSENHTQHDYSRMYSKLARNQNDVLVFHCNQLHGLSNGISLTYTNLDWSCKMSQKSYNLSCVEFENICQDIAGCIEETDIRSIGEIALDLEDCESPLEATRSDFRCTKIPIILEKETRAKYLKMCTSASQEDLQFYTDTKPYDTRCCGVELPFSDMHTHSASVTNCKQHHETCNEIMKCYFNFERTILKLLESFDMKGSLSIYVIVCTLGIITNFFSLYSDIFSVKAQGFLTIKIHLESVTFIVTIFYVSLTTISDSENIPKQMKWINDGILKWIAYVLLSLQSGITLIYCYYLALMTKFPLKTKEIEESLIHFMYIGLPFSVMFHIPRFFLDPTLSSSYCSLFSAKNLAYSYSLEFQVLKNTLKYGGSDMMNDDFYLNFHETCYDYYQHITSSNGFLIYNVILDSLFLHLIPTIMIIFSMATFIIEIKRFVKKRQEMNVVGKQLKIMNRGTMMFITQSVLMTARHSLMIVSSFYIWYHDRNNVFLTSTLAEQFSINLLNSVITICVANILAVLLSKFF